MGLAGGYLGESSSCCCEGRPGLGAQPPPRLPVLGPGSRGPLALFSESGGRRHGCLAPTPQCTLLQAGVARCGGGMRPSLGRAASCILEGCQGLGAHPPRLPILGASSPGPRPTYCGSGCGVLGTRTGPLGCMPCWTLPAMGVMGGFRGTGSPRPREGRLGLGAHPPAAPCSWGRQSGSAALVLDVRAARVWGPCTIPTARCVDGVKAPRRGAWRRNEGLPGSGTLPPLSVPASRMRPGPATHWL